MLRSFVSVFLWISCLLYGSLLLAQAVSSVAEVEELMRQGRRCQETQNFLQQRAGNRDPKVLLLRCQYFFDRKQYAEAGQACEQSIANGGGQVGAVHRLLGNVLSERINTVGVFGKMRLASRIQKELHVAVELNPKDVAAREGLAQFYSQAPGIAGGSWTKAYQQAAETAKFDPAQGHLISAELNRRKKDNAAAVSELHLAAQSATGSALVLFRVGSALLDLGYAEEAHYYLLQAFALDPRDPANSYQLARSNLLRSHSSNADLDQAERLLTDYVGRCPGAFRPEASEAQILLDRLSARRAEAVTDKPSLAQKP